MDGVIAKIDSPGLEIIIPAVLLIISLFPFLRTVKHAQLISILSAPIVFGLILGYFKYNNDLIKDASNNALLNSTPDQTKTKSPANPSNAYTSSKTCRACHPGEYDSWHNSYHRTMTQLAKPEAVLAKWHGTKLPHSGSQLKLEKKKNEYWVTTIGDDGTKESKQRITMTTGSHHLQVYWIGDKNGNLQHPFPFGWLIADQKWSPVEDTFLRDPESDPPNAKWNAVCIECHAVAGKPRILTSNKGIRTTKTEVAELGISCEACHGPAQEHIKYYQNPFNRYKTKDAKKVAIGIINPDDKKIDHKRSSQVCGQCHSYQFTPNKMDRYNNGPRFTPGGQLNASSNTVVVKPSSFTNDSINSKADLKKFISKHGHPHPGKEWLKDRFWPDGMVRVTGREYNGLLDTACFQKGKMSCLSCHSMHDYHDRNDQLAPQMDSNEACFKCHENLRDNLTSHTNHAADSTGSSCYNCHMPHTTYGLLNAIRSHQIDSPKVSTQLKTGRVNACNLCHINKSLKWTSENLIKWYGHEPVELSEDDKSISSILKMLLMGDAGQRVIAAWHMGWKPAREISGNDWQPGWLFRSMNDPYSAVRYIAHKALIIDPRLNKIEFDYTGPLTKRTEQIQNAKDFWTKALLNHDGLTSQPELLIDNQGKPIDIKAKYFESKRNNQPITLQE